MQPDNRCRRLFQGKLLGWMMLGFGWFPSKKNLLLAGLFAIIQNTAEHISALTTSRD